MVFKVLLIDDEPLALEGLQLWIPWKSLGFEVCALCGNGVEGLKRMEELEPDLVMVDIHMPVMDGLEMIEEWRRRGNWSTKFIILTGYSDFGFARKALKFKVSGYLLKPLDEEQAMSEVRTMRMELIKAQEQQYIGQIALREQEILTMKEALLGKVLSAEGTQLMDSLSRSAESWNVCLVQVAEKEFGRWSSIASEVLNGRNVCYIVRMRKNLVSIVFGDVSPGPQRTSDNIRKHLEILAHRLVGFRTYMAIGSTESSLKDISSSRITAEKALLHAFYEVEGNRIMDYALLENHDFQRYNKQVELIDRVMRSFQLIDYANYQSAVEFIEQSFRQMRVHPDDARKFVIYLLHEIWAYMRVKLAEDSGNYRLFEIPDLDEALLTFDDLIGMLNSCGKVCFEFLLKENVFEVQGIAQDINDYIHTHFREGLTVKLLAERFFLHPAYLGQLLKRKNGISFNVLLHNLRIEEACRLLQMNQYKNIEISEKVGYASYHHFLKQFEKRMGMSPNEYKKT
jgi:two-component system response regulator YesN